MAQFNGDESRVTYVTLDYSIIKTVTDLLNWTVATFELPIERNQDITAVWNSLWQMLAVRKKHYIILERFPRHMTTSIAQILDGTNGWKETLEFNASRDLRVEIAFFHDPETKGKKPNKSLEHTRQPSGCLDVQ